MQTLISVFDRQGAARKAVNRLLQSGFAQEDVQLRESPREPGVSVVSVHAGTDSEAESAAVTLHECGAIDVDDRDSAGGTPTLPGVRTYEH